MHDWPLQDFIHRIFDFKENESEAVRDKHASLQWVVLLFNVFLDCSADEILQKYLSNKFSRQITPDSMSCRKLLVI